MVHMNHFKRKGVVFYLQHPGSEPVIQQHVEAQDLEAGTAGDVVGETRVVVMFEDGVSGDQSLYDHVLDVVPHLVCVAADGLQQLVEGGKLSEGQKTTNMQSICSIRIQNKLHDKNKDCMHIYRLLPVSSSRTKFSLFLLMK